MNGRNDGMGFLSQGRGPQPGVQPFERAAVVPKNFAMLYLERGSTDREARLQEQERLWLDDQYCNLLDLPIYRAVEHIHLLESEAGEASVQSYHFQRMTWRLMETYARRLVYPEMLLGESIAAGVGPNLLFGPLDSAAKRQRPGWEQDAEWLLRSDPVPGSAIRVALTRPASFRLKTLAITAAAREQRERLLWTGWLLGMTQDVDDRTLDLILGPLNQDFARMAALDLWEMRYVRRPIRLDSLSLGMRARWRENIVNCPPSGNEGWTLGEILQWDPTICVAWVRSWFWRCQLAQGMELEFAEPVRTAIRNLPVEVRAELIANAPRNVPAVKLQGVFELLAASNIAAHAAILIRPEYEAFLYLTRPPYR